MKPRRQERLRDYNIEIRLSINDIQADINDIVEQLSIKPDVYKNKGSSLINPIPRHTYLVFTSTAGSWDASFEEHWYNLNQRLADLRGVLQKIPVASNPTCTIVIDYVGKFPVLFFGNEFIGFLDSINADLEIDVLDE